jgi:replicative DNA helicase
MIEAPYSQEAEEALLGAVLINPNAFMTVASFLRYDDFYFLRHSYIWQAMERLHERKDGIDNITLSKELDDLGLLNDVGGPAFLTHLIANTPTSVHAEVYGRLVERASIRRRLMVAADEIKALALDEQLNIESVTTEAEVRLFGVTDRQLKREFVTMDEAVHRYFDQIEFLMQNQHESMGVPSGFRDLDALLGGFQKQDLLIFAGRPGMGKTSFLLSAAVNAARLQARVAIFTMEMGVDQLVQRMISMETGISSQKLRLGRLSPQEYSRFVEAAGRVSRFNIFIDDTPAMNPIQMRTKCRRLAHEYGLDLIIVDYMQLMNAGGQYQNNRVQEISYISRSLKELARELNTPVFSAAQLSRAVEQRQDKRPVLSDLRESGCLASEALVHLYDEGRYIPIRDLVGKAGFRVTSLNTETWKLEPGIVTHAFCTGVKPVYRLTTTLGRSIRATANHKFLTISGWKRLDELTTDDRIALPRRVDTLTTQTVSDAELALLGHLIGDGCIYWDKVASIESDGNSEVYDLTVEKYHNFVSSNIIAHNSIEQDADIVMFLYRDVVYNDAAEFPNQADIIVAKHRNGPTGTVQLYFENNLTKFIDGAVRRVDLGDGA